MSRRGHSDSSTESVLVLGVLALGGLWLYRRWSKEHEPPTQLDDRRAIDPLIPHVPTPGAEEVPAVRTTVTIDEARGYLGAALARALGRAATPQQVAMLMAHSAHETATWAKMFNWNWGFVTTIGVLSWFRLKGNSLLFVSYTSPENGANEWCIYLARRYPKAWALLGSDNPAAYVHELAEGHYFGDGSEDAYARGVASHYRTFLAGVAA